MTHEPQRLQYLEAMGLTAWVARYRLPNARPSEACEWEAPAPATPARPAETLHALRDEVAREVPPPPVDEPVAHETLPRPIGRGKARALLGEAAPVPDKAPEAVPAPGEALRFTLQVACLDGRWLLMLPSEAPPDAVHRLLLANILLAAGVEPQQSPGFETFRWPLQEGLPVAAPREEAREGLQAFVEGRQRRGWAPEQLLLFGGDPVLESVLALKDGWCSPLALPVWQGPALETLAISASAKRGLWPTLAGWREAWHAPEGPDRERRSEDADPSPDV